MYPQYPVNSIRRLLFRRAYLGRDVDEWELERYDLAAEEMNQFRGRIDIGRVNEILRG